MNPFMHGHDIFEQMHRVITGSFHISVLNIIRMSQKFKTHFSLFIVYAQNLNFCSKQHCMC